MIVKDEAHVIERCLDSVKPLVDYVLIEDTGSTDGTQAIIRDWLGRENLPGDVIEEPWRDFAYNRTHAMERLREVDWVDYALIIDADDKLVLRAEFNMAAFKRGMSEDLYDVEIRHGGSRFHRPQICSNRLPFCFKAVLHEYLEAPPGLPLKRKDIPGLYIETGRGGARNKNPRKYQDDAANLEKALETETDPFLISRYTFYLAQSYRDCGEKERALANYLKRAKQGYWAEEVFVSLYGAAKLKQELGHPDEQVLAAFERAIEAGPGRAEALHGAALFCRTMGRNEEGFQFAKRAAALPLPAAGLFLEPWIYQYGALDELGINGFWSGHHREALDACLKVLAGHDLPESQRDRVIANARFNLDKLPPAPDLGEAGRKTMLDHHAIAPARPLRSRLPDPAPKVLLAILAKQKEEMLRLYLECIEALDYPKRRLSLYIRTNNNTDRTEAILREWVARVGHLYANVEFDASDVAEPVQYFAAHEWNATRFKVLGHIRNVSLRRALEEGCDYYFVVDVDNFIRPATLSELVALNLPIVAPLLRSLEPGRFYSNYHAEIDSAGYHRSADQYHWILNHWVRGLVEVPVVHTTYLVRADVIADLGYTDETSRHEYVVFSDRARKAQIPQYLDNRQVWGYIAFGEGSEQHVQGGVDRARALLADALASDAETAASRRHPRWFACFGLHSSGSTWVFNLARDICQAAGTPFVSAHRDSSANLPWNEPGEPLIIARTHNPMADFEELAANSPEPSVLTVRDPRDALVSLMTRFPNGDGATFDKALDAIGYSADRLVAVARRRELPVFRYEDGFIGADATFDKVADLLGVSLPPERRAAILGELSSEGVKQKIGELEAAGTILGEAVWDKETHWHAGHVGDGKVGKWRDALTPEQAREIMERTREYCAEFGYLEKVPLADRPATNAQRAADAPANHSRYIRLKEFARGSSFSVTPNSKYVAERDSSLLAKTYEIATDQDGFVVSGLAHQPGAYKVLVLGDSVVESMFCDPRLRLCARLEESLRSDHGLDVSVLNAGYSGATSLHSFNVLLNKIIPLKPTAVILLTGIVDVDVAYLEASFWSDDCYLEPIVYADIENRSRDSRKVENPDFEDRLKILELLSRAGKLFDIPVWFATLPHRQVFEGEYIAKAFRDKLDFDRQVDARRNMNRSTRQAAAAAGAPLFDLEAKLSQRTDIFYDMFHLNPLGGAAVAQSLLECGLGEELKKRIDVMALHNSASASSVSSKAVLQQLCEVHLINLDRSEARLRLFRERNVHLSNVVRVAAVDGARVDRAALISEDLIHEDLPYSPGALGCALSHISLWRKAVAEDRIVTVCEDDTVIARAFEIESARIVGELPPDWDLIQWGFVFDPLFAWIDLGITKSRLSFYDSDFKGRYSEFQARELSRHPMRLLHTFGTQAYSVSAKGAGLLLEKCLPLRNRRVPFEGTKIVNDDSGIDVVMAGVYGSLKAFTCLPPLVVQDDLAQSDRLTT